MVAPADGMVAEITRLEHDDFIGGPAVRIGIFLSIFNVHINRAPCAAPVIRLHYSPGLFLNALESGKRDQNENLWIGLEEAAPRTGGWSCGRSPACLPGASSAICGRAKNWSAGQKFGMIKLGSRTELILPADAGAGNSKWPWASACAAGSTIVARYEPSRRPGQAESYMRRIRTVAVFPTHVHAGKPGLRVFQHRGGRARRMRRRPTRSACRRVAATSTSSIPRGVMRQLDPDDPTQNIMLSGWLIFLAMIFDALDGHVARLSRATSDFGATRQPVRRGDVWRGAGFLLVKMCPQPTFQYRDVIWIIGASFAACARCGWRGSMSRPAKTTIT